MISLLYYDSLSSTMDEAYSQVLNGAPEGTIIVTTHQTDGRGRRGRLWESFKGNIYLTYITYCDCPLLKAPQLSFVACVALGEGLRTFLSLKSSLLYKWPNDILLNEKKVGGILLEAHHLPEKNERAYLIGCGVNLIGFPSAATYPATSFQKEGIQVSYEEALQKIGESLQHYISLWQKEGFAPIRTLWEKSIMALDQIVSLKGGDNDWKGICKGIDEEGALILETSQGIVKVVTGEIIEASSPRQYA